ncbi:MAG TPA: phosphate ABC transporter permease PstA [Candidatus Sulfotelmatobacter sp.]|nr:phosphate ABC transporter permease PstA [Candidatus Sulfotelmatobacter sp.]
MTTATAPIRRAGSRRAYRADRVATAVLWALGAFVMLLLTAIILHFVIASIGVVSPSFLFSDPSRTSLGGIGPLLWNSIYMLVLTMLISIPVGLLAGIYMAEYSRDGFVTATIRFAEEAISSVPSIVVGLFGLIAFVDLTHWGFTALGGALALTMFNLPLMARLTEQALRAVPPDERAASLALGATRWQTIRHVVVPLGVPGIVTGFILTAGRIFGEAAALIYTAGLATPSHYDFFNLNITDPRSPWSPFRPAATLSVYIWNTNGEGLGAFVTQVLNGSAAILIAMVLIFNVGARVLGRQLTRRLTAA